MDRKRLIHFIIMFVLTIGIGFLAPFGQITELGMKVLGIFTGVLYGWIFIDLIWPSIFGFVALGCVGWFRAQSAVGAGIGNGQTIMILMTMVFAGAMEEAGLTGFMADWALKRKIIRKNPWFLLIGIIVISYVMGVLGTAMAAIFLLWSLVIQIADECGINKKDPLISFMIMMIVIGPMSGSLILPFHGGPLIYLGFLTQASNLTIEYIPFMIFGFVITAMAIVLMFIIFKFVFRLDASKFVISEEFIAQLEAKKSTKAQRISFVILIIYIAALLLPGIFTKVPEMAFLSKLGIVGVSAIALLVMNFIVIDGKPLINITKVFTKHIQWPLLLLIAVTFPLADALKNADCGIMITITQFIKPIVSGMGATAFMIVSVVLLGLVTQVTHNIVLGAMFIPFLCPLCAELGGNEFTMWFIIFLVLNAAYVTPAASMNAAMAHGHEYMVKKNAYILGTVYLLITIVLLGVVGIPLGNLVF